MLRSSQVESGSADHPDVVAMPGGFDVLFSWQRTLSSPSEQVYLAQIRVGDPRHRSLRLLYPSKEYGLFVHGILDGSGNLDVLWMERNRPEYWSWKCERFTTDGTPLGKPITLDSVEYYHENYGGSKELNVVPDQWGVDLKRAPDGSVWAAWPVYLAVIALLLIKAFAAGNQPPNWILFIQALGSPYGWYAMLASLFATIWSGWLIFRHYDSLFRAMAMAMTSLYVVVGRDGAIHLELLDWDSSLLLARLRSEGLRR